MPKLAKRAQIIYQILQEDISKMDFSKKGEERVKEFLRAIQFENAGEVMTNSLLVIEEKKWSKIKTVEIYYALKDKGCQYDWQKYYLQLQSDFRRWCHCDSVREVAGKPTGANDLFRLYAFLDTM